MLINGQGGIGKTTFAAKYWLEYEKEYKYLAFLYVGNGIAGALLQTEFTNNLGINFPKKITDEEKLRIIFDFLATKLDKPCLLILDNANDAEDLGKYALALGKCSNFHILLTSRLANFENTYPYALGALDKVAALQVFQQNYEYYETTDETLFYEIFEAVGGNTLVMELLAKNLNNFNEPEIGYSLQNLYDDLQNSLLNLSKSKEVKTAYQAKGTGFRNEKPEVIILAMYDLSKLTENEIALLSVFAVLPPENIAFATLKALIDGETLKDSLDSLRKKGWIEFDKTTKSYKVSPLVQEITRDKNKERLFRDCEKLLENIAAEYEKIRTNRLQGYWLVPFMEGLIKYLPTNYDLIRLQNHLSNILIQSGQIEKAEQNQLNAKTKIDIENLQLYIGTNDILGVIYWKIGKIDEAITLFKQMELLLNLKPQTENPIWRTMLSDVYHHLSLCYEDKKEKEMRKLYSNKSLELQEKKDIQDFIRLSYLYEDEGNMQKALEEIQEGIKIFDIPENSNTLVLAILLFRAGQLITHIWSDGAKIGLVFLEKSQKIFENQPVKAPDKIEYLYHQLGLNHFRLNKFDKALFFAKKAKDIFEEHYGINHEDLIKFQKTIQEIEVAIQKQKFENIGRNDVCPCGSGKKYKKCCGK